MAILLGGILGGLEEVMLGLEAGRMCQYSRLSG